MAIQWMDEILHHLETMVETIPFVGIYVGESNHSRVYERLCSWKLRGGAIGGGLSLAQDNPKINPY